MVRFSILFSFRRPETTTRDLFRLHAIASARFKLLQKKIKRQCGSRPCPDFVHLHERLIVPRCDRRRYNWERASRNCLLRFRKQAPIRRKQKKDYALILGVRRRVKKWIEPPPSFERLSAVSTPIVCKALGEIYKLYIRLDRSDLKI